MSFKTDSSFNLNLSRNASDPAAIGLYKIIYIYITDLYKFSLINGPASMKHIDCKRRGLVW